ncbi:tyrosine--tRNA ligase [Vibrio gazogenes]|uniref:Tyrosine--tRNA ligase n=1 Tax=Vibrio gazogenes DSM 21264 = NBRC 103151 TaxID=1123492 RepID=A0A1M5EYX6_VIBGA|nr:tyrosine--tRNA ligase [Vibrio gazogenes]USP14768.1 tyrosine--tRNA ligase [Vibrio gazogenes]SHF84317.1 tyrosyl-tRNA synthetase [Vibrio gazogenes DSM 21264] [Vibrio gazogenes DSM 21264 = NBRC 103151]SJN55139.1 Tyrosine--tRNA ligase [Vibrio gazogenes]
MTLIQELQTRGLIAQASDLEQIQQQFSQPQTVYCGFDPTAGSLHIGHLVPLIMLKRFQDAGHQALALIGGATGKIGDPSFKATERSLNTEETVNGWVKDLTIQIEQLLAPHLSKPMTIVNNADWMKDINVIDFFRDVGKHFSINTMICRESVKQRLQRPDQGISFTEFSYSLLQSYDFAVLNRNYGCRLQIGGNDQWGNIVSGIDLTRRQNGEQVFGLTLPLITKSDGTKFGKTEGGAVWLDPEKTSPYMFYQFWLSTEDTDVYNLLRYYTFLSCDEIEKIELKDKASDGKPEAQKILAQNMTRFVHGESGLHSAERITQALFTGSVENLSFSELKQLELDGIPSIESTQQDIVELLVESRLAKSKRIARELIEGNAIRVNSEKITPESSQLDFPLFDQYWLIQRGKKHFCLVKRK